MIADIVKKLNKILFFLENFDEAWKSKNLKDIFPLHAQNRIEELERKTMTPGKYREIMNSFSNWEDIGVWNASDLLTLLFTCRISMYLSESVENRDLESVKETTKYLLFFVNYLLLTDVHPPSPAHRDSDPYYSPDNPFPKTYEEAQDKIRMVLAEFFSEKILADPVYKEEFGKTFGDEAISSTENLSKVLKEKFIPPEATPAFLIKNVGLAKELFIFHKLISENFGYVVPTLLYQRIFKELSSFAVERKKPLILVKTPDFLIIRGGRTMGIEVGPERRSYRTRKGDLITTFSGACGMPTTQIDVRVGNPLINTWQELGFKCNRCYKSFVLCDAFIKSECGEAESFYKLPPESLTCEKICGEHKARECLDAGVVADILNFETGRTNKKLVHYRCLLQNEVSPNLKPVPVYPTIDKIEILREWAS